MQVSKQASLLVDEFLSKYHSGLSEGYSAQHCLFAIREKCKQAVVNIQTFGTLLTDLLEACNSLPYGVSNCKTKRT